MNEKRIYLTDYINRMRNAYRQARAGFEVYANALVKEREKWNKEQQRGWRDPNERQEAYIKNEQTQRDLKNRLDSVVREAKAEFAEILNEANGVFDRHYRATPEQIDEKGLALINSGALSNRDLMALADEYPENYTMRKLIGAKLIETGEKQGYREMADKGRALQIVPNAHSQALEAVIKWGEYALRPEEIELSAVFDKQYMDRTDEIIAKVEGYSIPDTSNE